MTAIDPWFLYQMKEITDEITEIEQASDRVGYAASLCEAKRMGISDERLAEAWRMEGKGAAEKFATCARSTA